MLIVRIREHEQGQHAKPVDDGPERLIQQRERSVVVVVVGHRGSSSVGRGH
jgi:hypothetical protein